MRISTRITDIHSLRKAATYEICRDHCLAEKFAHLLSFQLPNKQTRGRDNGQVSLRLLHPKQSVDISSSLNVLAEQSGYKATDPLIQNIRTTCSKKSVMSDFYLDINTFKSCVLNTVISKHGAHGVNSDIHAWSIESNGDLSRRQPRNIVIDFSSPNIAKPFHAGHLRSTLIGNYLSTMYSALGDTVTKINYLGDWGTQFGLITAGYRLFGDRTQLKENAIQHLLELYIKMNQLKDTNPEIALEAERACTDLDQEKEDVHSLWKMIREATVENNNKIYKRLGVRFDCYEWESEHHVTARRLCDSLIEQGKLEYIDGAYQAVLPGNKGQGNKVVLLKSNGSTLYISRDIAAFISRYKKYKFDHILYVVDNGQSSHIAKIGNIVDDLHLMRDTTPAATASSLIQHVKFGRVHGMSTRKGTSVLLADILDEAKHRMIEKMRNTHTTRATGDKLGEVAESLSSSAVIVYDLRLSRLKDYTFDWEKVLSLGADTGPFLQITHSRLCSLEKNCGLELNPSPDLKHLVETEAIRLITHLARYDEAVRKSILQMESHILLRYLFDLCHLSNAAFKKLTVKDEVLTVAECRLYMFHCARLTLSNGLLLLGVEPLTSV